MKQFQWKNRFLRKYLTKTKEWAVETISLFDIVTLQQMNEEKKEKKEYDKCWWKIDENKYERTCEEEIREEKQELSIYDIRRSCREEFKCTNFSKALH